MNMCHNLPKNWKILKISDVLFFQEGPGVRKWQFKDSGVKLLNVGNINHGRINLSSTKKYISDTEAYGKYSHFLIDDGDLLIACSGIVVSNFHNKIAFVKKNHLPLCLNTSTMRFKVINDKIINLNYFRYFLQTHYFTAQLIKLITGSAQLNFGPSHIKKINLILPSISKQKKIADILDVADQLRQKNQQLIDHYTRLSQSLFVEIFGDPVTNPMEWKKGIIDNFSEVQGGLQVSAKRKELPILMKYLRVANIYRNKLKLDEIKTINITNSEFKRVILKENDLLIVEGHGNKNEIGRVGIWNDSIKPMVHQNHLIRVRVDENIINPIFLCHYLNSQGGRLSMIKRSNTTSGLNTISTKVVKNTMCLMPPHTLQNQFAQHIQKIEQQKKQAQASLEKSETLFNSLLQQAFKGELTQSHTL